jgi:hypothetical protein
MWNAQSHQSWQKSRPVAFNLASDSSRFLLPSQPKAEASQAIRAAEVALPPFLQEIH